jgi:hypothetical protein
LKLVLLVVLGFRIGALPFFCWRSEAKAKTLLTRVATFIKLKIKNHKSPGVSAIGRFMPIVYAFATILVD